MFSYKHIISMYKVETASCNKWVTRKKRREKKDQSGEDIVYNVQVSVKEPQRIGLQLIYHNI